MGVRSTAKASRRHCLPGWCAPVRLWPGARAALLIGCICQSLLCAGAWAASVEVNIDGIDGELRDNVEAFLGIAAEGQRKRTREEKQLTDADIQRLHRGATAEIRAALQPFGYYDPEVTATLEAGEEQSAEDAVSTVWHARYRIDPGPATRLRAVDIRLEGEGRDQDELRQLISEAGLEQGAVLYHPAYSSLKSALQSDAYALGYLNSTFTRSQLEVYPEQQVADVTVVFDTGPRFRFGDITIEQTILSQEFVDRFIETRAGEIFNPRKLIDLQLALSDSDYFRSAEVQVQREDAVGKQVPVRVTTEPSLPRRYEASLGYGTDTGLRGGLGVLWRRLNRQGHQLRTDIRLSQVQQTLVARYKIPVGEVRSEYLDFNADLDQREINDVDSTRYALGTSLNQNRWHGRRRMSLLLQQENWTFGDEPKEDSTLLITGLEYDRIRGDDLLFTRDGYSVNTAVYGAVEGLLSDATFLQGYLAARLVKPLGDRGRLLLRGEYGATATDSFHDLPPSQRFFSGGAQSVRGYGFEELSPEDSRGNLIGGRYLGVASIEVDYLVYGDIGLAAFVDSGNASDDPDIDWRTGAGVGLRYRTPVGMVRVDFAHPFDDPDSSFAFHISFGPDLQ
jgi:translocation and assembly module TamA